MLDIEPRETVSEEQIASAEKTLGLRSPEPYRSWLKATDGGLVPEDTVIPGRRGLA
ncbi:SMI1/KNR4 family protein [Microlunatus sp. GCM10028923]|uniref:SMI1/KNR4 family protein n=1 Tax=Microlunatus sp. GCM10028923 TaxID=3273400 RepID=UPI0036159AEB